ncbi:unnamed protein product, partial [Ectocarpus sp. 8 AP-2014]
SESKGSALADRSAQYLILLKSVCMYSSQNEYCTRNTGSVQAICIITSPVGLVGSGPFTQHVWWGYRFQRRRENTKHVNELAVGKSDELCTAARSRWDVSSLRRIFQHVG